MITAEIFSTENGLHYQEWRARKLDSYPAIPDFVSITDLEHLGIEQLSALRERIDLTNMALFEVADANTVTPARLLELGLQLGLKQPDHNICAEDIGVTALTVKENNAKRYIPYTNKPLSWHTDGYYNAPDQQVRAWMLYCAQPAASGGENELMDHDIAFLRIRDEDPRLIDALCHPQAMTIPANIDNGVEIRPEHTGPVFSLDPASNYLHMRYSARATNVVWYDDPAVRDAAELLREILATEESYLHRLKLSAGQGVISNNVLHRRTGFTDDPTQPARLLYRARYYSSISFGEQ
ncbi:MAG: TauD/TfdA family dioxygenase [bacterium]